MPPAICYRRPLLKRVPGVRGSRHGWQNYSEQADLARCLVADTVICPQKARCWTAYIATHNIWLGRFSLSSIRKQGSANRSGNSQERQQSPGTSSVLFALRYPATAPRTRFEKTKSSARQTESSMLVRRTCPPVHRAQLLLLC